MVHLKSSVKKKRLCSLSLEQFIILAKQVYKYEPFFNSYERSEYSYIGLAGFFSKKSLKFVHAQF